MPEYWDETTNSPSEAFHVELQRLFGLTLKDIEHLFERYDDDVREIFHVEDVVDILYAKDHFDNRESGYPWSNCGDAATSFTLLLEIMEVAKNKER